VAEPRASGRTGALPLFEASALVGQYRWLERRLFALTGRWSSGDGPPAARLYLAQRSARHGWNADLWADRLPVLDGVDPEGLTRPPSPATETLFEALADAEDGSAPLAGKLAALHRVVAPRLLAAYEWHLNHTVAVTDGPVAAVLEIVVADGRAAKNEGTRVMNSLFSDGPSRDVADRASGEIAEIADRATTDGRLVAWPDAEIARSPGRRA
jgi:hypothetical protein